MGLGVSLIKAYSINLRERVAAACTEPGATQTAVAARFCVSVSFVEKLRQRQRASGSVAALPHRNGPAPLLDAAARAELGACLRQQSDAGCHPGRVTGVGGRARVPAVSPATMDRAVQALDWRWTGSEKKSVHAAERDSGRVRALRAAFLEALQTEDVTCFKFVDETSTNLTYCRLYARAEGGQRAYHATPPCTVGRT